MALMPSELFGGVERTDASLDIVVLGGPQWGPETNQPAIQTVRALASQHRVLYICEESQGSTLHRLLFARNGGSSARVALKAARLSEVFTSMNAARVSDRLWVAPLRGLTRLMPLSYPEFIRTRSAAKLARFIGAETARIGMQRPVLWFYWWFFPELTRLPHSISVYDNTDDHNAYDHNRRWTSVRRATRTLERRLLQTVDLAYALSPELAVQMQSVNPQMRLQTPGIDAEAVTTALATSERPLDVTSLSRPLIGYAGAIGERLDWRVISDVAESRPDWTFVFVGGSRPVGLATGPNVHFLPGRPYHEIMRAIREFDVGIVPWIDSPGTRGAYSYKALDYLAAGKQVVATSLPFSVDLAARHPEIVTTVRSASEWGGAIARALERSSRPAVASQCVAAAYSRTTVTRTNAIVADVREIMARHAACGAAT
jgi:glycosyltransferase involved in cell wall biosynthesis